MPLLKQRTNGYDTQQSEAYKTTHLFLFGTIFVGFFKLPSLQVYCIVLFRYSFFFFIAAHCSTARKKYEANGSFTPEKRFLWCSKSLSCARALFSRLKMPNLATPSSWEELWSNLQRACQGPKFKGSLRLPLIFPKVAAKTNTLLTTNTRQRGRIAHRSPMATIFAKLSISRSLFWSLRSFLNPCCTQPQLWSMSTPVFSDKAKTPS